MLCLDDIKVEFERQEFKGTHTGISPKKDKSVLFPESVRSTQTVRCPYCGGSVYIYENGQVKLKDIPIRYSNTERYCTHMELIEFEILLYNRRQAVYTFSHINICGGNVNLFRVDSQHLFSPPNTNSEKYTSFPSARSAARSIQYLRVLRFMPFSRQNFRPLSLLSVNFLTNKAPSCSVTTTASFCVF